MKIEWTNEAINAAIAVRAKGPDVSTESILDAAAEIQFKDAETVVDESDMTNIYMLMKVGELDAD